MSKKRLVLLLTVWCREAAAMVTTQQCGFMGIHLKWAAFLSIWLRITCLVYVRVLGTFTFLMPSTKVSLYDAVWSWQLWGLNWCNELGHEVYSFVSATQWGEMEAIKLRIFWPSVSCLCLTRMTGDFSNQQIQISARKVERNLWLR